MNQEHTYRPELDGLRGIAVALVVASHAGVPIPGAALGPDIFFVLSGYLIVGLLLRRLHATGRIGFADFYARRFRRIVPAIAAAVGLTLVAIAILGDPFLLATTALDGAASLLGASNLRFGAQAIDYFAADQPSPLLPLWSIGVEEQFYLLVPLLIGAAYRFGGRRAVGRLLGITLLLSVIAAIVATPIDPVWSYYLLPTRAYGLALGGLLAVAERRLVASWLARLPLAPIGAALTALLVATLPAATGYPGAGGPLAVAAGGAMILGTAPGVTVSSAARRLLSVAPLRGLGRISYSLYLVHWPCLLLPLLAGATAEPTTTALSVLGAILLSSLLYLVVERPLRAGRFIGTTPRRVALRGLPLFAAALIVLVVIGTPPADDGSVNDGGSPVPTVVTNPSASPTSSQPSMQPTGQPSPSASGTPGTWGPILVGAITSNVLSGPAPTTLHPAIARAAYDADNVLSSGCGLRDGGSTPPLCPMGNVGGTKIVVVGDSHAAHWIPGLVALSAANNWEIVPLTKNNCPMLDYPVFNPRLGRVFTECTAWRANVISTIASLRPALVIFSFSGYPSATAPNDLRASTQAAAEERLIAQIHVPVAIFADIPRFSQLNPIPSCLARNQSDVRPCTISRAQSDPSGSHARDLLVGTELGIPVFDFTPGLCPGDVCAPIVDGIVIYHDQHHLTRTMSRHLIAAAAPELAALLTQLAVPH